MVVAHNDVLRHLAELRSHSDRAAGSGGVRVVNLCGPVGAGKTRILTEFAGTAPRPPATGRRRARDAAATPGPPPVAEQPRVPASAAAAAPGGVTVVDGADHATVIRYAREAVARVPAGSLVVVASRRPLAAHPDWAEVEHETVRVRPWPDPAIRNLAREHGVTGRIPVRVVADLAGGVPLIAECLCRALRAGTPADVTGALADAAARDVLRRLRTETAGPELGHLSLIASVGPTDEDLLAALVGLGPHGFATDGSARPEPASSDRTGRAGLPEPDGFDRVAGLSVVRPDRHGLTVVEPYRTLFDLAYAWRHPTRYRQLRARSSEHRREQVRTALDPGTRAGLADQMLFLSPDPRLRHTFFPPPTPRPPVRHPLRVRPATAADADAVVRLMHAWTTLEGLNPKATGRMLDRWMSLSAPGFDLLVDDDDRPCGMSNLTAIGTGTQATLEPLLQQHTLDLTSGPSEPATTPGGTGIVLGMMVANGDHPALRAMLLRHILASAIAAGRIVVSTSWQPYRRLCTQVGLRHVGDTSHDGHGCGRPNGIFEKHFTRANMSAWFAGLGHAALPVPLLAALTSAVPAPAPGKITTAGIRSALERLHDPVGLAREPLLAATALGTARELATFLREEITALAASGSAADAEAGAILRCYYIRRDSGHDALAHRLHLSRATYFRRLDHGLHRLAEAARWLAAP